MRRPLDNSSNRFTSFITTLNENNPFQAEKTSTDQEDFNSATAPENLLKMEPFDNRIACKSEHQEFS